MSKFYAGIGSRETPVAKLFFMAKLAYFLEKDGYTLRSGGATGADKAFSDGCKAKEIYVPWEGYNDLPYRYPVPDEAYIVAMNHHPNWERLSNGARKLMARNTMQILGPKLDNHSKFVICWTPDGCTSTGERTSKTGGTGQAISIATTYNIPVYNLARPGTDMVVLDTLTAYKEESWETTSEE